MKKIYTILLLLLTLSFGACGTDNKKLEVETLNDGLYPTKRMKTTNSAFTTGGTQFTAWFELTPEEFTTKINEEMAKKGYDPLVELSHSENSYRLTYDNETWFIDLSLVDGNYYKDGSGYIKEVELKLFSDSADNSKRNGDYIYGLINIFNPGLKDQISDELYIFDSPPDGSSSIRKIEVGKTHYTVVDGETSIKQFLIWPVYNYVKPTKPPSVIKPSS